MTPAPLLSLPGSAAAAAADAAPAQAAAAASAADPANRAKATDAAVKFEGLFIREMLKQMRRTAREIGGDEALAGGRSHEGMMDVADMLLADTLAGQKAFGIADAILRQILPPADASAPSAAPLKFSGVPAALTPQAAVPLRPGEAARREAGDTDNTGNTGDLPSTGLLP